MLAAAVLAVLVLALALAVSGLTAKALVALADLYPPLPTVLAGLMVKMATVMVTAVSTEAVAVAGGLDYKLAAVVVVVDFAGLRCL